MANPLVKAVVDHYRALGLPERRRELAKLLTTFAFECPGRGLSPCGHFYLEFRHAARSRSHCRLSNVQLEVSAQNSDGTHSLPSERWAAGAVVVSPFGGPRARPGRAFSRSHQFLGGSASVVVIGPRGIWWGAPSGGAVRGGSALVVTGLGRATSRGASPAVAGGETTVGAGDAATDGRLPPAWLFPAQ